MLAALAVCSAAVIGVPASGAAAASTGIEGTVTLPSGAPAADVCVGAFSDTAVWTQSVTDSDGHYRLDLNDGRYRVELDDCGGRDLVSAWWPGGISQNTAQSITVNGDVVTADQQLAQGGTVAGTIYDTHGSPLPHATVTWAPLQAQDEYPPDGGGTRTGDDGTYVMHGVPPGSWRVAAGDGDHPITFSGDTHDWLNASPVTVQASAATNQDIHAPHFATLTGTVTDESGAPRAGACVTVYGEKDYMVLIGRTTDSNGGYSINVPPGSLRVAFSSCRPPYTWYHDGDSFAHATPVDVVESATVTGIDQVLVRKPHLGGRVTDPDGQPAENVRVVLRDATSLAWLRESYTDADGQYVFDDLEPKLYMVQTLTAASKRPDLVSEYYPGVTSPGAAVPIPAAIDVDHVDLRLPVGGRIGGHVRAAADGSAVAGVCVTAGDTGATTASDGSYLVQGLAPGSYRVEARDCRSAPTLAPALASADVRALGLGDRRDGIDVAMQPGAILQGRVLDGSGQPLSAMCVSAAPVAGAAPAVSSYGFGFSDSTGTWTMRALVGGIDYDVRVAACDVSTPWVPKTVRTSSAAGSVTPVPDVTLHHGGGFSGLVTDQFGHPAYNVCVTAIPRDPEGSTRQYAQTTANGTYVLNGLEPGTYTAFYADCGLGMQHTYWKSLVDTSAATFTVTADTVRDSIDEQVLVYTLPSIPTNVTTIVGDGIATVSWNAPMDTGHTPITGYRVTTPSGAVTVAASTRTYTVAGLRNGQKYRLAVAAINAKGVGPAAVVDASPQPPEPARLTLTAATQVTAGSRTWLTGALTSTAGDPIGGHRVEILSRPAGSTGHWHALAYVVTAATGRWRYAVAPAAPTSYGAVAGALAATKTIRVAPRVTTTTHGRLLTVHVTLPRPAAAVRLQRLNGRHWITVTSGRLSASGRLTVHLPRAGRWRALLPRSGYWSVAVSAARAVL